MKKATTRLAVREKKGVANPDFTPPPVESYNKFVASTELIGIHLIQSKAEFHPEHLSADEEDLVLRVKSPQFRADYMEEARALSCGVRLTLALERSSGEGPEIVEVFAEYSVGYRLREDTECTDDIAHMFAGKNALFNVWPFFRELAFSLVARMGMPPLVLPLFRMPPHPKEGTH